MRVPAAALWVGVAVMFWGGESTLAQERAPLGAEARPVPRGIKGARFGMKPKALRKALPGLVDVEEVASEEVTFDWASARVTGTRLQARTTIGPREATCVFAFTAGERLTRIDCILDTGKDRKRYDAAWQGIVQALRAKYGRPTHTPVPYACKKEGDTYLEQEDCEGRWLWEDPNSKLEVWAEYYRFSSIIRSSIRILNQSPEFAKARAEAVREAEERVQVDEREKRRKAKILERHSRSYDKDL